jgi:hypothetical protein
MTQDDAEPDMPGEAGSPQPADPFEPEAPAHIDPDPETAAHRDADDEAVVDGADPSPPQPS